MAHYTSYDLVEFGKSLEERQRELPVPKGNEILVRVRRSGVCHSDLHIADGYLDLGEEGKLNMAERGLTLPLAMGHEIAGEVVAVGDRANEVLLGQTVLVFPWIGCGKCQACEEGRENDCMSMRIMGIVQDGGYATHVLVEDPKFLVNVAGMNLDTVAPYACSGLTVYNAIQEIGSIRDGEWLAVLGTGGLGLNAIAIARALGFKKIVALDIDEDKLKVASDMGADAVINSASTNVQEELQKVTNGSLSAVLDTVGAPVTSKLGVGSLIKRGKYVVVGLHGGDFKMPLPLLPQRALTVCGCHVGSSQQLRDLIELVREGNVKELPVTLRPLSEASAALDDLRAGKVTGRVVLNAD